MKIFFLIPIILSWSSLYAEALTATVTESAKMEVTRGKGTIILKPGTVIEVVGKEGDNLSVVYRNITGVVPASKTDFKGTAPTVVPAAASAATGVSRSSGETSMPPTVKGPDPKSVEAKGSAPANPENPTSNYGKMVKKARDNVEKHKENLVDPVDNATATKKN